MWAVHATGGTLDREDGQGEHVVTREPALALARGEPELGLEPGEARAEGREGGGLRRIERMFSIAAVVDVNLGSPAWMVATSWTQSQGVATASGWGECSSLAS